ncbi:hypothetical protein [Bernardetia sp.]|uniref:hypothetical protein n=1 Tax=Bernardetia sp. TaxID=1937974 RepID=UPI0025C33C50|nr:hypothetical protein [Bernardetia sp.]
MKPHEIFENHQGKLFNEYNDNSLVEKAYETYRDKTFLEANKGKYSVFNITSYVFQILSSLFAATFMYLKVCSPLIPSVIPQDIKMIAAGILTAFFLIVIEYTKRIFIMPFVESIIKSKSIKNGHRIKFEYLLVNLPLLALSVYTSATGAELFVKEQTDNTQEIKTVFVSQKDSINNLYTPQITQTQKSIQDLTDRLSKRKWGFTKEESQILQTTQEQLKTLQAEREKALSELKDTEKETLTKNDTDTGQTAKFVLIGSLICELAGIFCIAWCAFFFGKVFVEAYHIAQIQKDTTRSKEPKKEKETEAQEPQKKSLPKPVNNAKKTSATEEPTPSFAVQNVGTNGTTENETEIRTENPTQPPTNFPTIFRRLNGTKKSAPS